MAEGKASLRQSLAWGIIAFSVALAVVIGVRLDQAALTVIVGVACGVGASIPTSLLIVTLLQRRNEKREMRDKKREMRGKRRTAVQPPPVVVIAPSSAPQLRQQATWPEEYALPLPAQRQFSVIGEEEIEGF